LGWVWCVVAFFFEMNSGFVNGLVGVVVVVDGMV
jgi:hypothetical protein